MAVRKVRLGVGSKFELTTLHGNCRVNARLGQSCQVVLALIWIHDMNRLVTALEPVRYKRKQYTVFFFIAVEKSAYMAGDIELGSRKGNGTCSLNHLNLPGG